MTNIIVKKWDTCNFHQSTPLDVLHHNVHWHYRHLEIIQIVCCQMAIKFSNAPLSGLSQNIKSLILSSAVVLHKNTTHSFWTTLTGIYKLVLIFNIFFSNICNQLLSFKKALRVDWKVQENKFNKTPQDPHTWMCQYWEILQHFLIHYY